jgi:hypothetical protein
MWATATLRVACYYAFEPICFRRGKTDGLTTYTWLPVDALLPFLLFAVPDFGWWILDVLSLFLLTGVLRGQQTNVLHLTAVAAIAALDAHCMQLSRRCH